MSQSQPRLLSTRPRAERANRRELIRLLNYLAGRGWTLRKFIRADLGIKDDALRALVRYSDGQIVSSSSLGYCRVDEVTISEGWHACAELMSRAASLKLRAAEIQRRMYRPRPVQTTHVVTGNNLPGDAA
jgi:hypothetical protein